MEMGDFLSQPVIDRELVMVFNSESLSDQLGRLETDPERFRRGPLEIGVLFFVDDQQVDRPLGTVVGDDDYLIGLKENLRRQFAPDDAGEDGGHGRNISSASWTAIPLLPMWLSFVNFLGAPGLAHGIKE